MTETSTNQVVDIKSLITQDLEKGRKNAEMNARQFKERQSITESEWLRYFGMIRKISNNFVLIEEEEIEKFKIYVNTFNPDGTINYSNNRMVIGYIDVKFKTYEIKYVGKLPKTGGVPKIIVCTSDNRKKSVSENNSYVMKALTQHNWSNEYKTAKKIVSIIEDWIEVKLRSEKLVEDSINLKKRAIDNITQKYPNNNVYFSDKGEIVVINPNNTTIVMAYGQDSENNLFYEVRRCEFPKNITFDFLIEKLGNL